MHRNFSASSPMTSGMLWHAPAVAMDVASTVALGRCGTEARVFGDAMHTRVCRLFTERVPSLGPSLARATRLSRRLPSGFAKTSPPAICKACLKNSSLSRSRSSASSRNTTPLNQKYWAAGIPLWLYHAAVPCTRLRSRVA